MLSRRREQFVMLLGLLVVNSVLGWYLYRQWRNYSGRIRWIYNGVVQEAAPVRSTGPAAQVEAQSFAEIVNRNLFRPERSNESPVENAKVPELPVLFGTMNLGKGSFALMAPGDQLSGVSKRVFPGEEIGGYKLVSIAGSQVVVEWGEKKATIVASESVRRVARVIERTANTTAASPPVTSASGPSSSQVNTVPASSANAAQRKNYSAAGFNAPPGAPADAPPGTVMGGKRKVVQQLFGMEKVYWEDVPKPGGTPEKPNPQ